MQTFVPFHWIQACGPFFTSASAASHFSNTLSLDPLLMSTLMPPAGSVDGMSGSICTCGVPGGCGESCSGPPELPPVPVGGCGCGCGREAGDCANVVMPTGWRRQRGIDPLAPGKAGASLASRLGVVADRARQLNTKFGIRPYRVFLVWTRFDGAESGEGYEVLMRRTEILPTPKVDSLDNVAFSPWHAGVLQVGSLKVSEVSTVSFGEDVLRGFDTTLIPDLGLCGPSPTIPEPWDFFYEVVEDARGGDCPERPRYRLANVPFRKAESQEWVFTLERSSRERSRLDRSYFGRPGGPR